MEEVICGKKLYIIRTACLKTAKNVLPITLSNETQASLMYLITTFHCLALNERVLVVVKALN